MTRKSWRSNRPLDPIADFDAEAERRIDDRVDWLEDRRSVSPWFDPDDELGRAA